MKGVETLWQKASTITTEVFRLSIVYVKYVFMFLVTDFRFGLKLLDETQEGFRKQYSIIDNTFILHSVTEIYLSKKRGRFYCLFIDFEKAFAYVNHDRL